MTNWMRGIAYEIVVLPLLWLSPGSAFGLVSTADCTQPASVTTCQDEVYVSQCLAGYDPTDTVNNPCLQPQPPDGKSFAQQAQEQYDASVPGGLVDTVFDPDVDTFRPSRATPPQPAFTLQNAAGGSAWANRELVAQYSAYVAPNAVPLTYQRDSNTTQKITSCENYVYRAFLDVERWIDAVNACKGDAGCEVDASLNGYTAAGQSTLPGIARRRPQNSDGNYVYDPTDPANHLAQLVASGKVDQGEADPFDDAWQLTNVPKKAFHAGTEFLFPPSFLASLETELSTVGLDPQTAQDLVNELARGDGLYTMGKGVPVSAGGYYLYTNGKVHQGFYDEWDFHHYMRQATQASTSGEWREYRRRNDQVVQAWGQLGDAMKCLFADGTLPGGGCLGGNRNVPNALGKTRPGDALLYETDPLMARSVIAGIAPIQAAQPPSLSGQIGFGSQLQSSRYSLAQLVTADVVRGEQVIPAAAHVPGELAPNGVTNSLLFAQLGLSPKVVAKLSPQQIEAAAAVEVAYANSIAGSATVPPAGGDDALANYVATFTPSTSPFGGTTFMVQRTWQINPPRWTIDPNGNPILDCSVTRGGEFGFGTLLVVDSLFHTERMWAPTCALTNVVLAEWYRHLAGRPSCLDRTSTACDWMPPDFVDRVVNRYRSYASAAKEIEYQYCKRWTGGNQMLVATTSKKPCADPQVAGVPATSRTSLVWLRTCLDQRQQAFESVLRTVPVQGNDDFGKTKTDGNHLGNGSFGGGYEYTLGWHAKVKRYQGTSRDPNNGKICQVGGSINATFTADATVFGQEIHVVDATASVQNELNTATPTGWSDLVVGGFTIIDTGDPDHPLTLTGSAAPVDATEIVHNPQFVEAPFQVGWVTVIAKAGLVFDLGSQFSQSATGSTSSNPTAPAPWEERAVFAPQVDVGVWCTIDSSLPGVFAVAPESSLTVLRTTLPLAVDVALVQDPQTGSPAIDFDTGLDLTLAPLSGEFDVHLIASWARVANFKLVGWDGSRSRFPLFRTRAVLLDLPNLPPQSIMPPGGTAASENL